MTDYKPGTVAVATVRGIPNVRVFRTESADNDNYSVWRHARVGEHYSSYPKDVTDIRPLVVLDLGPQAARQAGRLRAIASGESAGNRVALLTQIADQIEAQTKPPRIPQPGKWGVVADKHGYYWTSTMPDRWVRLNDGVDWPWVDIEEPALVREGVED